MWAFSIAATIGFVLLVPVALCLIGMCIGRFLEMIDDGQDNGW